MKRIPLTQGKFALVDDEDYEFLNQWKWYANTSGGNICASRANPLGSRFAPLAMHRVIMNPGSKLLVDHKNHNTLDNRKSNLRVCNHIQNSANRLKQKPKSTSKYKGVHLRAENGNFIARISINKKRIYLGDFKTQKEAAKAYDLAAKENFGEFACLNFKRKVA